MKQFFASIIKKISTILELFISLMLAAGIVLLCIRMVTSIGNIPDLDRWPNYDDLLETCFNLIIGVELIRMMYYHTPDTVFEVLIFAIARQIIIVHSSIWGSLIGVLSIAILFATRKYLFCGFDQADTIDLLPNMKVRIANKIFGISIPYKNQSDSILDVFMEKCKEDAIEIEEGIIVNLNNVGLRAAKINKGRVTKIELIRAANE